MNRRIPLGKIYFGNLLFFIALFVFFQTIGKGYSPNPAMKFMLGLIIIISTAAVILPLYALPTLYAWNIRHKNTGLIAVINLIGGFFFGIGWLVAAAIACNGNVEKTTNIQFQLEQLERLKNGKMISEEEYQQKRAKFLS